MRTIETLSIQTAPDENGYMCARRSVAFNTLNSAILSIFTLTIRRNINKNALDNLTLTLSLYHEHAYHTEVHRYTFICR